MTSKAVLWFALAAWLTVGAVPQSRACGHCKEDKIAATYDYAVVSAARRHGRSVVYAELRGAIGPASPLGPWIRQQVESSTGVVRGTARVSLEPAAISFSCEHQAVSSTLRTIGEKLARRGLGLVLLEAQAAPKTTATKS